LTADAPDEVERTRRLYRWVAPLYDPFRSLWSRWTRPAEEELDRLFRERIGPGARVLELAPGTGINLERLLRCAPGFGSYLGIDASPEMLERARSKAGSDPRIALRLGDATTPPEGSFDFLVCTWLLSHLDAPAETVRRAIRKLEPDGTAVFVFFTAPRSPLLRRVLGRLGGPGRYRFVDPEPIARQLRPESLWSCAGGMATVAVFRGAGGSEAC
jgi:ubiquinone/menaquinone biosynthesis C-methylase UbiE